MGEADKDVLRVGFDRVVKLAFHGATVSSDAGLFPYRELDEAAGLTESRPPTWPDVTIENGTHDDGATLLLWSNAV